MRGKNDKEMYTLSYRTREFMKKRKVQIVDKVSSFVDDPVVVITSNIINSKHLKKRSLILLLLWSYVIPK